MPRTPVFIATAVALMAAISCSSGPAPAATQAPAGAPAAAPAGGPSGQGADRRGRGLPDIPAVPKPAFIETVVPGGTSFDAALDSALASNRSRIEDPVRAHVVTDVVVRGRTTIPAGTPITGTVLQATPAGRPIGHAAVAFRFLDIHPYGNAIRFRADRIVRDASTATDDVTLEPGTIFRVSLDDAIRVQIPTE